jgi:hypothetical protein
MMKKFRISGVVKRFPGQYGWYYIELSQKLSKDFRPLIKDRWPALLKASFTLRNTSWNSSIMPIKDGPLFIALPAKIRKVEDIKKGKRLSVSVEVKV